MMVIKTNYIPHGHVGLKFRNGRFVALLAPGTHMILGYSHRVKVYKAWHGQPWIDLPVNELKQLRDSVLLQDIAKFVDLSDRQRALVWLDGRFQGILGPGLYGYWTTLVDVRIEIFDTSDIRFEHGDADVILRHADAKRYLNTYEIPERHAAVLYQDGEFAQLLQPGRYAFWKDVGQVRLYKYDLREKVLDVTGQEIMTADKVTLRMNAVLSYRIQDVRKVAETAADVEQVLYRELQLIVRAEVGARTLDQLLADKANVATGAFEAICEKAADYGLEVRGLGIRDVILPGDMKELLNQVIEAEKAAQANNIKRREETAAMRSQLNSAKLIEQNPILMRLRELESVEKFADKASLQIFVGDGQGMADRIVKLI